MPIPIADDWAALTASVISAYWRLAASADRLVSSTRSDCILTAIALKMPPAITTTALVARDCAASAVTVPLSRGSVSSA